VGVAGVQSIALEHLPGCRILGPVASRGRRAAQVQRARSIGRDRRAGLIEDSADTPAPPRRCCLAALAPAGWTGRYAASRSFRCRRGCPPEAACPALIERRGQRLSRQNRQPGWRIIISETKDRGGGALSWRVAVPWDNRDTFIEMAGRHLGCYGWDAVAWPTEIGTTMTIPLIRNTSGHQIDEAERCTGPPG
jgi:hypothetical protein